MRASTPWVLTISALIAASGCLDFPKDGRYKCASDSDVDCVHAGGALTVKTQSLPDGYLGRAYQATLEATGGSGTYTWELQQGALPSGISLGANGMLSGTVDSATPEGSIDLVLKVDDGTGAQRTSGFTLTILQPPRFTTTSLPRGNTGSSYSGTLEAKGGKPPLTITATGLPGGLTVDAHGTISGTPTGDGAFTVKARATDANGTFTEKPFTLSIGNVGPIPGGGTSGPSITDSVTVYAFDGERPVEGIGVRLRKNGAELNPIQQALTDATGAARFTGLALNGTTDTVDVTVSGSGYINASMLQVNATAITVPVTRWAEPFPRHGFSSTWDSIGRRVVVAMGKVDQVPGMNGCPSDLVALNDPSEARWNELAPTGLTTSPRGRMNASLAPVGGYLALFGGTDCTGTTPFGDLWLYEEGTRTWSSPATSCAGCTNSNTGPSARARAAMATDPKQPFQLWLFGGETANGIYSNELFMYELNTRTWQQIFQQATIPIPARVNAGMVAQNGGVMICGGTDVSQAPLQDCWTTTPNYGFASLPPLPQPAYAVKLAVNPNNSHVFALPVLKTAENPLWEYDPAAQKWSTAIPSSNGPKPDPDSQVFEWDLNLNAFVATSARDNGVVWSTDGASAWKERGVALPSVSEPTLQVDVNGFSGASQYALSGVDRMSGFSSSYTVYQPQTVALPVPAEPSASFVVSAVAIDQALGMPLATWSQTNPPGNSTRIVWTPVAAAEVVEQRGQFTLPPELANVPGLSVTGSSGITFPEITTPITNGGVLIDVPSGTFAARHLPTEGGAEQWVELDVGSYSSSACEYAMTRERLPEAGPLSFEAIRGLTQLAPGVPVCALQTQPPNATEGTYRFTVPAMTPQLAVFRRYAGGSFGDWIIYMPAQPGPNSFTLPQLSDLTLGRQSPAAQTVMWNVLAYGAGPNGNVPAFDYDAMSLRTVQSDRAALSFGNTFVRGP